MKPSAEVPTTEDGRDVDERLGVLSGEASHQLVKGDPANEYPTSKETYERLPLLERASPTYYDLPVLKEPVWKPTIPLYFYVGGAAGSAMALSAAISFTGTKGLENLARHCRWIGLGGAGLSAVLLISDLGRPSRFYNMLRVFRPSSPMNVGAWILSAFGAGTAGAFLLAGGNGAAGRVGRTMELAAGISGLGLVSYTGVLLSNSAIPAWQGAYRSLPFVFTASGATGGASILELLPGNRAERRVVRLFAIASKAAELYGTELMMKELRREPRTAKPYESGASGALFKVARAAVMSSLALSVASAVVPSLRRPAGILGTLGSLTLRYAVFRAGVRSARDPRATFERQRAGFGAAEVVKAPASPHVP